MKTLTTNQSLRLSLDFLLNDCYSDILSKNHIFFITHKIWSETRKSNQYSNITKRTLQYLGQRFKDDTGKRQWRYKHILDLLTEKGIIEINDKYSTGRFSKGYRLTEEFIMLLNKYDNELLTLDVSDSTYDLLIGNCPKPTHPELLLHWESLHKIEIDLQKAFLAIDDLKKTNPQRATRAFKDVINFLNKRFHVSRKKETGRVTSLFNLCVKEIRECFTYQGEQIVELDLKSSQPYFYANELVKYNPTSKDVQRFYDIVVKEDVYEYIGTRIGITERKKIKEEFYSYMYKTKVYKSDMLKPKVQTVIEKEFPEVHTIMDNLCKDETPLWLRMQKQEADIFVGSVNNFLSKGKIALSVHDAIAFPKSMRKSVMYQLKARFSKANLINYTLK
ncbi:hypothetical protein [Carboxylicivirga sp. RSCT41]|uniref:hypothetical protein n=1 Tax=Carboxylicivirga agarovorans TaxID=3417570 RepID=UPI003D342E64